MRFDRIASLIFCWALMLGFAAPAVAAQQPEALLEDFPAGAIQSVDQAERALERLPGARAEAEQRLARGKADCYERFFVSSCLSDVQQESRKLRTAIRRVEVEARAFLRKEKAAERDRAVADRELRAAEQGRRSIPLSGAARVAGESLEPEPEAAGR